MSDLREQIAEIVREAIHAGFEDGTASNVYKPDPPPAHYADRILALTKEEDTREWYEGQAQEEQLARYRTHFSRTERDRETP
jgi:hypothetical protein